MIIAFISTYEYIKVKDDCQQEKIVIIICFCDDSYERIVSDKIKSFYRVIHSKSFEGNIFNNRGELFFLFSACSEPRRAAHKV